MTDEVIVTKITEHDKHLDALTHTLDKTNDKLENIVMVMSKQNVLIEKMSSLGRSVDTVRDVARATEAIVNKMPDQEDLKTAVKTAEALPSAVTMRWGIGILLAYIVASGNYIVTHMVDAESAIDKCNSDISTHKKVDDIIALDLSKRLEKLETKAD